MKKRFATGVLLLALGFVSVGRAHAAPAGAQSPYYRILVLEQERSLGNGELAGYLASTDELIATRAALAIGRTKQKDGLPLLEAHLNDSRVPVRAMSVYGLGLIGGAPTTPILAALNSDPSGAVRVAAIDALGRYDAAHALRGDESAAARAIATALATDRDPIVRARAAIALQAFNHDAMGFLAEQALVTALENDPEIMVRRHAMWGIARGYAIRVARPVLTRALHDRDEIVRIEAVIAYGRLKNKNAIPALQPLLNDPSWRVQEQAAESIRDLAGQPATEHLAALPANLHLPPVAPDPLATLQPFASATNAKPIAPVASDAVLQPKIDPHNASDMNGPAPGLHPRVRIVTTKGNLYVTLYPEWAPLTVANFLNVAATGYYNNNRWFRIVPDFVVQSGDPTDNGDGDAGYTIGAEENPLEQRSYVLSMGMNYNGQGPMRDSAGTQYYITLSPQFHLNRDFTVFGEVTWGQNVLARLVESDRIIRIERIPDVPVP
jgi:peptidyl-prolyl cis-trans isomerase B (cyclophilin B)